MLYRQKGETTSLSFWRDLQSLLGLKTMFSLFPLLVLKGTDFAIGYLLFFLSRGDNAHGSPQLFQVN